jgi:uncharacterized membrane protein
MDNWIYVLTSITAIGAALVGGVLFTFSVFVMKALTRLTAEQGIAAMQAINITVLNPLCSLLFFGTGLGSLSLVIVSFYRWGDPGAGYLLAGSLLYIGALIVTGAFNVPLNNKLAVLVPNSIVAAQFWPLFVSRWMKWNHIRTMACIASSAFLFLAFTEM